MSSTSYRRGACILALYAALAMVQSWPLPLHMGTHLTGAPTGDTGVYVWNLWIFRHELINLGTTPFRTLEILPLAGPTDLSLHNYTVFSDVLALPLLGWLDIVTTFNVIYLINVTLAGFGMYLLARRLTRRTPEAFVAGLLFAWSPFMAARGQEHFSLVAAAPLPIFMLMLHRAWDTRRLRDAVFAGATLAWATFCDPYYGVYCLMLGAAFFTTRVLAVTLVRRPVPDLRGAKHLIDVAVGLLATLIVGVHFLAGGKLRLGAFQISMRTLYTPMLLLTMLIVVRAGLSLGVRIRTLPFPPKRWMLRAAIAAGIVTVLLMSPTLYAVGARMFDGRMVSAPVLWRSSAPGVDLLAFLMPNPNHFLAPSAVVRWLTAGPGGYVEQVAALSWIGFIVIFAAWKFARFRPGRFWPVLTTGFGLLTLGPFLTVAGVNTNIPTPWALLRYVPIVGAARMPARFSIVATMGFAVVFALALTTLGERFPGRRRWLLAAVAVLLGFELLPAPRKLYAAQLPAVFERVVADPRPVRVLELPTGVRDGLSSLGNFNAISQFHQTMHGKGLIGGYLSRVSARRKDVYRNQPVTRALIEVSEGRQLDPSTLARALRNVDGFMHASNLGYVVMNRERVSNELREFAIALLGLTKVDDADGYELYVPLDRHSIHLPD